MKKNSIFWGIVIILVGIILFGNSFEIWNIDIFFKGWWTLFIIIPSIYSIIKKEFMSGLLGLIIGVLLLLASQNVITWSMVGKAFLPVVLVMIGLSLIFRPKVKTNVVNKNGLKEYIGIFSGNKEIITDKFEGASCVSVFGGVELDLRDAKIKDNIVIECVSIFGGIDLRMPDNVKVETSGIPIFGGVENKYKCAEGKTVVINYVCVFGGIDIK